MRQKLLQISAATIDRLLKKERARYRGKGLCGTRPGGLLKHQSRQLALLVPQGQTQGFGRPALRL